MSAESRRSFGENQDIVRRTKQEREDDFNRRLLTRISGLKDRKFHGELTVRFGDGGVTLLEVHERIKPDAV